MVAVLCSGVLPASDARFDLEGTVTGADGAGKLRAQLFSVETPYTAVASVKNGRFNFHSLPAGDYTVTVVRDKLGEVRHTVVVSPSLADAHGVVTTEIAYSPADAAFSQTLAMISMNRLAVPADAEDAYQQARQSLVRHDLEGALRLFRRAIERAPDFADAWNSLGVLAFQNGDLAEAERCYRLAVQADPQAFDAALNLGALLLRTGHALEALEYNQRATANRPADAAANAQLGVNFFQLGRFDDAEPYLLEAKRLDTAQPMQPQLFLAEIHRQRGHTRAAAAELGELLSLRPDGPLAAVLREKITMLAAR